MRVFLAIQCFFLILFGRPLPPKALPAPLEPSEPEDKKLERERLGKELGEARTALAAAEAARDTAKQAGADEAKKAEGAQKDAAKAHDKALADLSAEKAEAKAAAEAAEERAAKLKDEVAEAKGKLGKARDDGALALLAWLQREGRLIDFLQEDIDDYDDEQVGAAVRAIHKGCKKVLDEGLELEAILPGEEESAIEVPAGFDPVAISLTGKVSGDPPFKGTLMHHGWRTGTIKVPVPEAVDTHVLAAAEVEL
jgi:chromosome segregation ATPase